MKLDVSFLGFTLRSPILVASGPASHDVNQVTVAEEHHIGGIVLKTACADAYEHMRFWPRPRYKLLDWDKQLAGRSKMFTLYSYEQGYSGSLQDYWDFIGACKKRATVPIIASIFAGDARDWEEMAKQCEGNGADGLELDISSPHRPGSLDFETTFVAAIKVVVKAVKIPVLVKIAAGPDVQHQAIVAEQCGAAGLTLCNRIRGFDVDVETQRPILHGYFAGMGGPWSKYFVFKHLAESATVVKIPIAATGGIMTGEDVIKSILLGASVVQVLSVIMVNGWDSLNRIEAEVQEYMERRALQFMAHPDKIVRWSGEPKKGPRNVWHTD
jgi:dihydroorotate dehydrogenase